MPRRRGSNPQYLFALFLGLVEGIEQPLGMAMGKHSPTALGQWLAGASTNTTDTVREGAGYALGRDLSGLVITALQDPEAREFVVRLKDGLDKVLDGTGGTATFLGNVGTEAAGAADSAFGAVASIFADDD